MCGGAFLVLGGVGRPHAAPVPARWRRAGLVHACLWTDGATWTRVGQDVGTSPLRGRAGAATTETDPPGAPDVPPPFPPRTATLGSGPDAALFDRVTTAIQATANYDFLAVAK